MIDMTLFDRIKKLAGSQGKSLKNVALELGFGENSLYGWKTKNPGIDKLQAVADYFGVSTDYLLGRTDDPSVKDGGLTNNQKRVAYSIDPDISDDEREAIIITNRDILQNHGI